jgi:hypothetical protein
MSKLAFAAGAIGAAAKRLTQEMVRQNWGVLGASRKRPWGQCSQRGQLTFPRT